MKIINAWPFLTLAAFTLIVGVAFHLAGVHRDSGPIGTAFYYFAYVLGAPFIGSMTLVTRLVSNSAIRPLLGLILGISPYVAADVLLRRRRRQPKT